jgi:2-polyprenyl-6-methoxyphenol hydroxylase-like FAD-dependent oxidoreductase
VLVIGAGLGGLCLAQGLAQARIGVTVYERDCAADARRQGYLLHMHPQGSLALASCLPPALFQLYQATANRLTEPVALYDHQLHPRPVEAAGEPSELARSRTSVNRQTLREILLHGLQDVVQFGRSFARLDEAGEGRIRIRFTDGSWADGDLLVAADGAASVCRPLLVPQAQLIDSGIRAIYGKTPLGAAPARFQGGFGRYLGPDGTMMLAVPYCKRQPFALATAQLAPTLRLTEPDDYVMWAVCAARDQLPGGDAQLRAADGAALQAMATALIGGWHPWLRRLVCAAEAAAIFPVVFRHSAPLPRWQTTRATLLGDAIHAMPPYRGVGAATALRDAALLTQCLKRVMAGDCSLDDAVAGYEAAMLDYSFAAVASSVQAGQRFAKSF